MPVNDSWTLPKSVRFETAKELQSASVSNLNAMLQVDVERGAWQPNVSEGVTTPTQPRSSSDKASDDLDEVAIVFYVEILRTIETKM